MVKKELVPIYLSISYINYLYYVTTDLPVTSDLTVQCLMECYDGEYWSWATISVTISSGSNRSNVIKVPNYAETTGTVCIKSINITKDNESLYFIKDTRKLVKATVTGYDGRGLVLSSAISVDYDFYLYDYNWGWFTDNPLTIKAGNTSYGRSISPASIGAAGGPNGEPKEAIVYY